jgi:hypothetical protein
VALILPYWFAPRQGKAEPVGTDEYRLTAPNLPEAYISIRKADSGLWSAALRLVKDGPEIDVTRAQFPTSTEAWEGAFELYRMNVVV